MPRSIEAPDVPQGTSEKSAEFSERGAPDYSAWLTKQQAADAIGVSTKTVETLAQDRQLQQASWRRPTGGPALAVYHPGDVARIARARRPAATAFVVPAVTDAPRGANGAGALELATLTPAGGVPGDDVLRALLAAALRAVTSENGASSEKSQKVYLSLPEAARVSGLSQACLRRLIETGKLEALRDRGWRIRRRDVEQL